MHFIPGSSIVLGYSIGSILRLYPPPPPSHQASYQSLLPVGMHVVLLLLEAVTSARYTKFLFLLSISSNSTGKAVVLVNVTFTRESHSFSGLSLDGLSSDSADSMSVMVLVPIPQSGQLNSVTTRVSTFSQPLKSRAIVESLSLLNCSASKSLAHMLPSSPVSVGMCPSNRTLEAGSEQVVVSPLKVPLEQPP